MVTVKSVLGRSSSVSYKLAQFGTAKVELWWTGGINRCIVKMSVITEFDGILLGLRVANDNTVKWRKKLAK